MCTVHGVRERVATVTSVAGSDPERAHSEEDDLWEQVLTAIAEGVSDPAGLAREALGTRTADYPRWMA